MYAFGNYVIAQCSRVNRSITRARFTLIHFSLFVQKYKLSKTLNVSTSLDVFGNFSTENQDHKRLQEAINTTCKLHEAKNTLAKINLNDTTAYEILSTMSTKSLNDACTWTTSTLNEDFSSSYNVQCDNSSLTDLCSQWNDVVAINKVESKVDILSDSYTDNTAAIRTVDEKKWLNRQSFNSSFTFLREKYNCTASGNVLMC